MRSMSQNYSNTILIHYGSEIGLKGKNQPQFRRRLKENLQLKLKSMGMDWVVDETRGHLSISIPSKYEGLIEPALQKIGEVFGVAWLAHARRIPHHGFTWDSQASDTKDLHSHFVELANERYAAGKTFCVRVNRADKSLPFTSSEMEARLGDVIIKNTKWRQVNLSRPDETFYAEFRKNSCYLFSTKVNGPGGLPVGTSGRVLVLLSGGIDSPVAAYLMAQRGCNVDFIHFTATSLQQTEAENYKVKRIAQHLSNYTLRSRLYLVPYTYFDIALFGHRVHHDLIVFRRFMARVAEELGSQIRAAAVVTGDSLGQVASQTLSNIVSVSRVTGLPILRPLLTYGKNGIVEMAKQIGTFEDSIEPYKDCCSLISRHPKTHSDHNELSELEQHVFSDYQKLIDQTLSDSLCIKFEAGKPLK